MLKKILSVSGRSGLFKLISQGKNMFIVESMIDGKRIPVYTKDKVVSLGDISIYTDKEEVSLAKVLTAIKQKENGAQIIFSSTIKPEELRTYFSEILPDFDKERVYPSDIKKIMNWYNLLLQNDLTDFEEKEDVAEKEDTVEKEDVAENENAENIENT
ncbi:MAG: DUF5606 domain-containing protein [Dysgonamonadaceae bacterium]|jgi:hypothetical protein|nr:DUF5606 domain-containing protein [Dysgonamonadaceae bacterium]